MYKKGAIAAVLLAGAVSLAGCYETDEVTIHQPGKYKGPKDSLLEQRASVREEALQKRFELVQTDR